MHLPGLLVIDDDRHILRSLEINLERDGFAVRVAESGGEALAKLEQAMPDLAIVDLLLPDMHGFQLCRKIKAQRDIPIVMLTAVGTEESTVEGLEKFADDYIVKPYRYRELLARINKILERSRHLLPPRLVCLVPGTLSLDLSRRVMLCGDREVSLTGTEYRLLVCLARKCNQLVSRDTLLDEVWPDGDGDPLRLKVAIHRLRSKLEAEAGNGGCLVSLRGRGYMLQSV